MYNQTFIVTRDGSQYNRKYYRIEGNILQVRYTSIEGTSNVSYPVIRWKDLRIVEL